MNKNAFVNCFAFVLIVLNGGHPVLGINKQGHEIAEYSHGIRKSAYCMLCLYAMNYFVTYFFILCRHV